MALFSVRSERQFCERLGYDLLFSWTYRGAGGFDDYSPPSHNSKTVLSTVYVGGPAWTRTTDLSLIRTAL